MLNHHKNQLAIVDKKTPPTYAFIVNFTVYILECADKTYYTGCTSNLEKRIGEHGSAKAGAHYTKIRRPVKLIYSEEFKTLAQGRKREAEIKRLTRKEKGKLSGSHK